jgi:hypothetical protein
LYIALDPKDTSREGIKMNVTTASNTSRADLLSRAQNYGSTVG